MAIKERKQITGTTAQIDAYEGHEGQIVWDKDKKTFVGMSGTAGKNYPLAPQAYVDTKFLPLTGGTITGSLEVNNFGSLVKNSATGYDELILQVYDRANQWSGGLLSLRGHNGSVEEERGSFILAARNKEGSSSSTLLGTPSGNLLWSGKVVERLEYLSEDGYNGVAVRYASGLMIITGSLGTQNYKATVTFPAPFFNRAFTLSVTPTWPNSAVPSVGVDDHNLGNTSFTVVSSSPIVGVFYIAIGRWK